MQGYLGVSANWKIFFLDRALRGGKKRHFFLADGRLWIKHQRIATRTHRHKSHQMAQRHTHVLTHSHQHSLQIKIKNRARMEEERFANWPDHPRRKGFKYHWKWGQCDCITSGSAELVKCLWWPSNSILQIVCIMSQITLHEGSPANWRFKSSSSSDVIEGVQLYEIVCTWVYRQYKTPQLHTKYIKAQTYCL